MLRTNLIVIACCLAMFRQTLCSCGDGTECVYAETPLETTDITPWETTLAEDLAILETPQSGTWRWQPSDSAVTIDAVGMEFPAVATFVHDPQGLRLQEYVTGGQGSFCDATTVLIDGTLTITTEQGEVIVSVPITAERMAMESDQYLSMNAYPLDEVFPTGVHPTETYEQTGFFCDVTWIDNARLYAEFGYFGQNMTTATIYDGVATQVGIFEPDPERATFLDPRHPPGTPGACWALALPVVRISSQRCAHSRAPYPARPQPY